MKASHILLAVVLTLGVLLGSAHAEIETPATTFVRVNTLEIGSTAYNVYDMMVTSAIYWTNAKLEITLTTGEFYNTVGFGGDTQPTAASIGLVPDLEWDTYARTPGGETSPASFTPGSQFGQNTLTADPPPGNTVIDAGWFWTGDAGPGTDRIARLTLSLNANGTIGGRVYDGSPGGPNPIINSFDGMYFIAGGSILPEPPPPPSPPEAHTDGPYTIFSGESVVLGAWQSTDPDGDIASYRWDLDGDEVFETNAGDQYNYEATPAHLASLGIGGGHHSISVLVTDGEGLSDTAETLLTIMIHGDANLDGFVDDSDLALVLSNWTGPLGTGRTWAHGDFDGDGGVSDDDLSLLLSNWTGPPPPGGATIPEPATLSLLTLAPLAVMRRRRGSTGGER